MGSVKDLVVLEEPKKDKEGAGEFIFSDRYSVFDWGEMPDLIEGKGKAICIMGAYFFEKLEKEGGVKTHYEGVIDPEDGKLKKLSEVKNPPDRMRIKLLRVIKPAFRNGKYDYSAYKTERGNFLIPLEIIYRNSLPEGSSVFRRLREGKLKLEDLGLSEMPKPGQKLEKPVIDVSTKLEEIDRYISWEEAKEISGLSDEEVQKLRELSLLANELITKRTSEVGISNEDGKFEFGFSPEREIIFVDVLGTPDECRFIFQGMQISKEILRKFYRNTPWYEEIEEAKRKDPVNWRKLVKSPPPPLPSDLKNFVSELYMSCCNEITGREWFKVQDLSSIVSALKSYF